MRREGRLSLLAGIALLTMLGCGGGDPSGQSQSETRAVQLARAEAKAPPPTNPRAPATRPSGYGKEEYRVVEQPDEIVSVLKNGLTVVCKRVPSPVVAVRGYVQTGGVYEG